MVRHDMIYCEAEGNYPEAPHVQMGRIEERRGHLVPLPNERSYISLLRGGLASGPCAGPWTIRRSPLADGRAALHGAAARVHGASFAIEMVTP